MPIRKSSNSGIPFGQDAGRPQNPLFGQPFFNGDAARLELYTTATGWQNIIQETPAVVSIVGTYSESQVSNTLTINGTNFAIGAVTLATGTNGVDIQATTTSVISVVEISATFSGLDKIYEPYDIKVVNPSNLYGILYETLQIDDTPIWNVQSGTLGTFIEQSPLSINTGVFDDENQSIIYSVSSGSLPGGLAIDSGTGVISGTPSDIIPNTTYSFTLDAFDGHNHTTRNYSISITDRGPVWGTAATLPSFSKGSAYSTNVVAVDDNAGTVVYSLLSGSLPTGISLSSDGTISGTTQTTLPKTFTIRATDPSGNYTDRQFTMANAGPSWSTAAGVLSTAIQGAYYSQQLSASDDSGIAVTYSLVSGSLPPGLSLSTSGLISGTVTAGNASSPFTIRASDDNGVYVDRSFSIPVTIISRFTSSGTFTVPSGVTSINYLVVAGGGSGAGNNSTNIACGGGGAGGYLAGSLSVSAGQQYSVTIGAGGLGQATTNDGANGRKGGNSVFGSVTATGGGGGSAYNTTGAQYDGGSGGGGGYGGVGTGIAGQGNNGGSGSGQYYAGGGGGANAAGVGNPSRPDGGAGKQWIDGNYYAGGGGGWGSSGSGSGANGNGIGGTGGGASAPGNSGTANTGGGGAGLGSGSGGAGGSGIVLIAYGG